MRTSVLAGVAAIMFLQCGPAEGRPRITPETLLPAIDELKPTSVTGADCDIELRNAEVSDAANLLYGAAACSAAKRPVESAFLMISGQTRFLADSAGWPPDLEEGSGKDELSGAATLYGVIFFHMGGLGPDEAYTDPSRTKDLLDRFDRWNPAYSAGHDPGWKVSGPPKAAEFRATLAEGKDRRRKQAATYGRLMTDPAYVAIEDEYRELQRRNPGGFVEGTPDAERSRRLLEAKSDYWSKAEQP